MTTSFAFVEQVHDSTEINHDDSIFSSLAVNVLDFAHRQLQHSSGSAQQNRGRFILMTLYLCMLALCFVTPIFYYFRLRCEDQQSQRLRRLEAASMAVALEESQQLHRQESRAMRRKYVEERRARLIQLFAPVRMILKEEHFVTTPPTKIPTLRSRLTDDTETTSRSLEEGEETVAENNQRKADVLGENKKENIETGSTAKKSEEKQAKSKANEESDDSENPYGDEESVVIRIPAAGLHLTQSDKPQEMRSVPGMCTICLCAYEVGSDVVWSSNSACKHVFHESCIERWLMKQREGPLCPCCKRDFVVDPYDQDLEEDGKRKRNIPVHGEEPWTDWTETMDFDEEAGE